MKAEFMQRTADGRILILMPTPRDSARTARIFATASLPFTICENLDQLCRGIRAGAGVALLLEEICDSDRAGCLQAALAEQPPWSDFPLVVLARAGGSGHRLRESMNVTLVERPVKVRSLLSVIRAALRSRAHQYEVRDHLLERKQTQKSLELADRRKDEFLATLAHELRNPLAPLKNSVAILQMNAAADPTIQHSCEIMERQVNHLVRLVDDLMEVSRITRGKIELRKERLELAAVARNAVEISRPVIDAARVHLSLALPPEPIELDGDFVRLSQVLANLLNNAAKYTNQGGQIWLSAKRDRDELAISVRDTGIGIPAEMLPSVFDLFVQVDRATSRAQGGLGIGLTLVRSLIEMHDGSVEVRSEGVDRGSEFIVRLPLPKRQTLTLPAASSAHANGASTMRRVLIVDDNRDAAATLGTLLKCLGADVRVTNDGESALAAMETQRPDVVLLDLGMPGMDGLEVARRVRSRPEFARILLIALTGWGQEDDRRRTSEAGFDHHLVKPVDLAALQSFLAPRD
jgi:signal transduction histidine kinase/CheY-like chemotaxis protein